MEGHFVFNSDNLETYSRYAHTLILVRISAVLNCIFLFCKLA